MRIRRLPTTLAAVLPCLTLAACTTVNSADVRTSGIYAHINATAETGGVRVTVAMDTGTFTSVELHGDQLTASTAGRETTSFSESSLLGSHSYSAFIPGAAAPGQTVTVRLKRAGDSVSTTSTVALPSPITVTSPVREARTRRSSDILLSTSGGLDAASVAWSGSCVTSGSQEFADSAAIVIPAGAITGVATQSCLVTLAVSNVRIGSLDGAYKGGAIHGLRTTTVIVWSAP